MRKSKFILALFLALSLIIPQMAHAAQSTPPYVSTIKVINNQTGTPDTVTVSDLYEGDIVKVYANPSTTVTIGTGTVAVGSTSIVISIPQIGTAAGTLYVSVTSGSDSQSNRTPKSFAAEPTSAFLDAAQIGITNNPTGTSDIVEVVNLVASDVIRVYNSPIDPTVIGTATVPAGQTSVSISIAQIGSKNGILYLTRSTGSAQESARIGKSFKAEVASPMISTADITVTNFTTGTADTIVIRNVRAADIIKVYATDRDNTPIATKTATSTTETLTVAQLGKTAGQIYVTLTRGTMAESNRVSKAYSAEAASTLPVTNIKIVNNTGTVDTITVANLNPTDIIRIYANKTTTTPLAIGTANKNLLPPAYTWNLHANATATSNYGLRLVATAAGQLTYYDVPVLASQSYAYQVTNTNSGTVNVKTLDASKVVIATKATSTAASPSAAFVTESNAAYIRFEFTSTAAGTFNWSNAQIELGTAVTAFEEQESWPTKNVLPPFTKWNSLHVNTDILSDYKLKLTATAANERSYVRVKAQPSTVYAFSMQHTGQVTISSISAAGATLATHYNGSTAQSGSFTTSASTAYIEFAVANSASGSFTYTNPMLQIGGTASKFEPMATAKVNAFLTVPQLGTTAGSVYMTITTPGNLESARLVKSYIAEAPTAALNIKAITVKNNKVGTNDTITVTGLAPGDVVKLYQTKLTATVFASSTVGASANMTTISVPQLGVAKGTIFVTVTNTGKTQSVRVAKTYLAE
ncbi:hypothetical protein [Bacillus sp. FJAT-28004]|uniref:hypothetical protein n=1 Tax=Bacillus sp. FJAT-28004 TaxID=1679165 RepID=UPI0006B52FC8|nr:hypothetical protein [Bacillus sp. FJAT-28004]